MTEQEIIDGNKLIAVFMGIPTCDRCNGCGRYKFGSSIYYRPDEMKYHTSWDWLMPVVEKIRSLRAYNNEKELSMMSNITVGIEGTNNLNGAHNNWRSHLLGRITFIKYAPDKTQTYEGIETPHIVSHSSNSIECIYKIVTQFITWYNSQTK